MQQSAEFAAPPRVVPPTPVPAQSIDDFDTGTGPTTPITPHSTNGSESRAAVWPPVQTQPAVQEAAPPRDRSFYGRLAMAEWLLKYRDQLLDEIDGGRAVAVIVADLILVTVLPTVFYGLVVGVATNNLLRVLTNPIKLPLMLVLTMCLCLPTLYIFSSYLGSRRSFLQTSAMGFTGLAILGIVLAAFAPITWFLTFTSPGAYALHVLVNVAVFAVGGFMGVSFLIAGARRMSGTESGQKAQLSFLWAWIVLYGLVGAQMGYLFSPFFSSSSVVFRSPGTSTFFTAVWSLIQKLFS